MNQRGFIPTAKHRENWMHFASQIPLEIKEWKERKEMNEMRPPRKEVGIK